MIGVTLIAPSQYRGKKLTIEGEVIKMLKPELGLLMQKKKVSQTFLQVQNKNTALRHGLSRLRGQN